MSHINKRIKRKERIRAKISERTELPRLSIFRSNRFIAAQIIDDQKGKTIVGLSEKGAKIESNNKIEKAKELGKQIAKKAIEKKVSEVVFDRGSYAYHGRVKAVAEGAREGGLKF
jgi:large subunit ribosomal protein L18